MRRATRPAPTSSQRGRTSASSFFPSGFSSTTAPAAVAAPPPPASLRYRHAARSTGPVAPLLTPQISDSALRHGAGYRHQPRYLQAKQRGWTQPDSAPPVSPARRLGERWEFSASFNRILFGSC